MQTSKYVALQSMCISSMPSATRITSSSPADMPSLPQMPHANAFFAEVDVCHSNPCANGATCVESADSYKCFCLPSYGGDRCEIGRVGSASAYNY